MVRIPSFSRRPQTAPARGGSGDGRIDERDESLNAGSATAAMRDRADDSTTYRSAASTAPVADTGRTDVQTDERAAAERAAERSADDVETERLAAHRAVDTGGTAVVAPVGPRPRASLLATLGLICGVAAALFVLTGALAGYGIGLGAVALLLSIGGLSATGRRHVAGKPDALIGLVLGLGAVVVGMLAITGSLSWLTAEGDTVGRFREWLDAQFVDRF